MRVGMLHAGRLDGVAGEVDVGMRALFDQEEWCGADGRSAIRRALGRAGEAMGLPPARSGALERAAAADVARLVLGGVLPALEAVRRDMVHSESRLRDPGSCATQVAQILSERRFMPEDAVFTAA